jgi:uncharacterized protein
MIPRNSYNEKITRSFQTVPIVILIGARQVGKTTIAENYPAEGKKLLLSGQDPEVAEIFQKLSLLETYLKVYLDAELNGLLLIDEFQYIPGVSTILKVLTDKHKAIKVLCTGSSSLDILQQVEESLAGRVRIIEVYSLSFSEYILFHSFQLSELLATFTVETEESALTSQFENILEQYLLYGGLPRAALNHNPEEKLAVLEDIYKTYLLRDVRGYIKNEYFLGFNKLVRILAAQTGNLVNVNGLSRETGLPYKKCEEFLYLLQQMYIIKLVEPYFTNRRKSISKMKKIYFYDVGLRNMITANFTDIDFHPDKGALFENFIYLEMSRNLPPGGKINFFRTPDGVEVDFVVNRLNKTQAVECKFSKVKKPFSLKSLTSFGDMENIPDRIIFNRNLNATWNGTRLIQGFLAGLVK